VTEDPTRGWRLFRALLRELPLALRVHTLLQLIFPVAIVLGVIGAMSGNNVLLIVGLVLGGAFVIDTAVVYPILLARDDSRRRRVK
jgi:hypothetical protein